MPIFLRTPPPDQTPLLSIFRFFRWAILFFPKFIIPQHVESDICTRRVQCGIDNFFSMMYSLELVVAKVSRVLHSFIFIIIMCQHFKRLIMFQLLTNSSYKDQELRLSNFPGPKGLRGGRGC